MAILKRKAHHFPWFSLIVFVVYLCFAVVQPQDSSFTLKIGNIFGAYSVSSMSAGARALQAVAYVAALPFIEAFFGFPLAFIAFFVGFMYMSERSSCSSGRSCCGSGLFWPVITAALVCSGYIFNNAMLGPVAASIFVVAAALGLAAFDAAGGPLHSDPFIFYHHSEMAMMGAIVASSFLLSFGEKSAIFPLLVACVFYFVALLTSSSACFPGEPAT